MKKLNTYTYENNKAIATIKNEGRYWLLTITHAEKIIIISESSRIWNTLRGAKEYALNVLSNY